MSTQDFHSPQDNNTTTRRNTNPYQYPQNYNYLQDYNAQMSNDINPYSSYEHFATPIPPPPPPSLPSQSTRKVWIISLCLFSIAILLAGTAYFGYTFGKSFSHRGSPSSPSNPTRIPTLDTQTMIHAGDFSKFLEAFASAMANKDYATIQSATDTENFQSVVLRADGGFGSWSEMYAQLTTGNTSFVITYPPITADQESYNCEGYTKQGITQLGITINADDIQYVVGTTFEPNMPTNNAQTVPNSTVFVFELPLGPGGGSWLWRAVIFNNSIGCGM